MSDLFDNHPGGNLDRDRQALERLGWTRRQVPTRSGKPAYVWTDPAGQEWSEAQALISLHENRKANP